MCICCTFVKATFNTRLYLLSNGDKARSTICIFCNTNVTYSTCSNMDGAHDIKKEYVAQCYQNVKLRNNKLWLRLLFQLFIENYYFRLNT